MDGSRSIRLYERTNNKTIRMIPEPTKTIDKPAINNWQKKVIVNNIVIPKSGWSINKVIKNKKNIKTKYKDNLLPWIPLLKNHALITKKNGFKNSEGWKLNPPHNCNQRFAPFIS